MPGPDLWAAADGAWSPTAGRARRAPTAADRDARATAGAGAARRSGARRARAGWARGGISGRVLELGHKDFSVNLQKEVRELSRRGPRTNAECLVLSRRYPEQPGAPTSASPRSDLARNRRVRCGAGPTDLSVAEIRMRRYRGETDPGVTFQFRILEVNHDCARWHKSQTPCPWMWRQRSVPSKASSTAAPRERS